MATNDLAFGNDIFKRYYPLSYFDNEAINVIAAKARLNHMGKSDVLFQMGSNDSYVVYLVRGEIKLTAKPGEEFILSSDSDQAKYPVANLKPRRFTAKVASEDALMAFIPVDVIEAFLSNSKSKARVEKNVINTEDEDTKILDSDWMMALLQTPMFSRLPTEQIEKLFETMEEVEVKAGDEIIREGGFGGYYFLIKKGECSVTQNEAGEEKLLAKLYPTQGFGEEALLLNSKRSATVKMISNGVLMRISNANFAKFLSKNMIHWVDSQNAMEIVNRGAVKLDLTDTTTPDFDISDATKIAPDLLRKELPGLSDTKTYLIFSDSDKDGALASYLLSTRGIKGYVLKTGK